MPLAPELRDHPQVGRPFAAPISDRIAAVPLAPQERIDVPRPETRHGLGHLALEGQPAHLPVGDHLQARRFLEGDGLIDGAVLDGLEPGLRDTAGRQVLLRFEKLRRPEQAGNDVGMCFHPGGLPAELKEFATWRGLRFVPGNSAMLCCGLQSGVEISGR